MNKSQKASWVAFRERALKNWRWWVCLPGILVVAVLGLTVVVIEQVMRWIGERIARALEAMLVFYKKGFPTAPISEEEEYEMELVQAANDRIRQRRVPYNNVNEEID